MDDQRRPITMVCDMPMCTSRRTLPPMNQPRWMPGRRGIGFIDTTTQSNIWVQPLDGSAPRQLTHFTDGRTIADFIWSPDGAQLAVARAIETDDIVLFTGFRK
jgi:hypothetical protein